MREVMTKRCVECGELLPATEEYFHWEGRRRGKKLRNKCKCCVAVYNGEYYEANREAIKKRKAAYYRANRDRAIRRAKRWQARNPGKVREYNRRAYRRRKRERMMRVLAGRN